MQRRDYADGELIVAQGDPSDYVYRILSGEVEIFSARNWWRRDPDEVVAVIKDRYQSAV